MPIYPEPHAFIELQSNSVRQPRSSSASSQVRFTLTGRLDGEDEDLSSGQGLIMDSIHAPEWHRDLECDTLLLPRNALQPAFTDLERGAVAVESGLIPPHQILNAVTPQWPPQAGLAPWSSQTCTGIDSTFLSSAPRRTTSEAEDALCIICYDQPACMVLLSCGHGGACKRCSQLLFARPPHACAVCRQPILAIVQLEKRPRVGEVANILKDLDPMEIQGDVMT